MSKPNGGSPDDRVPRDLASLSASYRVRLEDCDLIPDELRAYPLDEVLAKAEQLMWQIKIRKRLGLDDA